MRCCVLLQPLCHDTLHNAGGADAAGEGRRGAGHWRYAASRGLSGSRSRRSGRAGSSKPSAARSGGEPGVGEHERTGKGECKQKLQRDQEHPGDECQRRRRREVFENSQDDRRHDMEQELMGRRDCAAPTVDGILGAADHRQTTSSSGAHRHSERQAASVGEVHGQGDARPYEADRGRLGDESRLREEDKTATKNALASVEARWAAVENRKQIGGGGKFSTAEHDADARRTDPTTKQGAEGGWLQDSMVLGNWPKETAVEEKLRKARLWCAARTGSHLNAWAPPRSSIVKIWFEAQVLMRKKLFIVREATEMEIDAGFRKVWSAQEGTPSQAVRRKRCREAAEAIMARLPAGTFVRLDAPAGEVSTAAWS